MKILNSVVLAVLAVLPSQVFAVDTFLCVHQSGDISLDLTVSIERDGEDLSVFRVISGSVLRDDRWAYQVFAENAELGLQAVRTNPEIGGASTTIAVEYGGLLFITWNESEIYAYAVSAQASTRTTETQIFTCERQ